MGIFMVFLAPKAIQLVPFNFFRKVFANASFVQKKQIPSVKL